MKYYFIIKTKYPYIIFHQKFMTIFIKDFVKQFYDSF